ncbi:MAG: DUF5662 family protein [Chloroflexi bacterium]|nr:DUF5662 family protein [Chloroflexota bacterium]
MPVLPLSIHDPDHVFFTADTHFGHENIIKYCRRPFASVGEMDAALIANWNEVVGEQDTVFHLGDFTLGGPDVAQRYFSQLNGRIRVLSGSHDQRWLEANSLILSAPFRSKPTCRVFEVSPILSLEIPELGNNGYPQVIVLCHYALRVWDRSHHGAWHLYGHSHRPAAGDGAVYRRGGGYVELSASFAGNHHGDDASAMRDHIAYLRYVLRHKWFVFWECQKLRVPLLQAILHDWHKFLPDEWFPYAHYFYRPDGTPRQHRDGTGYYKPTDTGDHDFDYAWLLHQKRGKHHWQWWVLPEDNGGLKVLPIPDRYRREMLADWRGAGRAQGTPDTLAWYVKNKEKMQLHPTTRAWVEEQLGYQRGEL